MLYMSEFASLMHADALGMLTCLLNHSTAQANNGLRNTVYAVLCHKSQIKYLTIESMGYTLYPIEVPTN